MPQLDREPAVGGLGSRTASIRSASAGPLESTRAAGAPAIVIVIEADLPHRCVVESRPPGSCWKGGIPLALLHRKQALRIANACVAPSSGPSACLRRYCAGTRDGTRWRLTDLGFGRGGLGRQSSGRKNIFTLMSESRCQLRILNQRRRAAIGMSQIQPLVDDKVLRPAETALALELVSDIDLLRLKTIARLHARGLPPDIGWDDLLQEAFTRVITGQRVQPEGVTTVAFLAGIMRSLKAEHLRRVSKSGGHALRLDPTVGGSRDLELCDPAPSPERSLSARQELNAIERLFADDAVALQIIAGLGRGLSAEQIRAAEGISRVDYDSARRRMRRSLIREGLTCEPK